jgi:MazG-like family
MEYTTLAEANAVRHKEWDPGNQINLAFRGNEMAGEIGEALEQAVNLILMSAAAGRACNFIKKLERERMGIRGSRATPQQAMDELADVVICSYLVAMDIGGDLDDAVRRKFNETSEKMGLQTRLVAP